MVDVLDVERIEPTVFRGRSPHTSLRQLFGGHVAAQALVTAGQTVDPAHHVHSMHAYFLRPAVAELPVLYQITPTRDSKSFSTRAIGATQQGLEVFSATASFHRPEAGVLTRQVDAPHLADPDRLDSTQDTALALRWESEWPSWDIRPEPSSTRTDQINIWMRTRQPLPDDPFVHACALTYASDMTMIPTAVAAVGLHPVDHGLFASSLDHSLWFHAPFRADEWLLHQQVPVLAACGRAFVTSRVFDRAGRLVASVAQEGLFRQLSR